MVANHQQDNLEDHLKNLVKEEVKPQEVQVLSPTLPHGVETFLTTFKRRQEETAKECLNVADMLDSMAVNLRNRAAALNHQAEQIPDDVANSVLYERESHRIADLLAVVEGANK